MGIVTLNKLGGGINFGAAGTSARRISVTNALFDFAATANWSVNVVVLLQTFTGTLNLVSIGNGSNTSVKFNMAVNSGFGGYANISVQGNNGILQANVYPATPFQTGKLLSFTFTKNNLTAKHYINGTLVGTATVTSTYVPATVLTIGNADGGGFPCTFPFYSVSLFDTDLSQADSLWMHQQDGYVIPSKAGNVIVNYEFNEGSGTNVKDSGKNGIDATISNFTSTAFGSSNCWIDNEQQPRLN